MDAEVYLAHHGIKGQRWGVRRYQNKDGTLTKLGRKRLGIDKSGRQLRKEAKEKKKQEEIAKKEADEKQKLRNEIIKNPNKYFENKDAFSREEIENIFKDIELDRRTKDIRIKDYERVITQTRQAVDLSKKVVEIANAAVAGYNTYVDIFNAINKNGETKLKIGEKQQTSTDDWKKTLMTADPKKLLENSNKLTNEQLKDLNVRLTNLSQISAKLPGVSQNAVQKNENSTTLPSSKGSVIESVINSNKDTKVSKIGSYIFEDERGNISYFDPKKQKNDYAYIDKIMKGGETHYLYKDDSGGILNTKTNKIVESVINSNKDTKVSKIGSYIFEDERGNISYFDPKKQKNDYAYIDKIMKGGETRYLYEDDKGVSSSH